VFHTRGRFDEEVWIVTHEERDRLLRRIHRHHVADDDEDFADPDEVLEEEVWEIANNTA
jgi:hypothetical protein